MAVIFYQNDPNLLYQLLKFPARLALGIYGRKIRIGNSKALAYEGPLLICCNHPNSFLDAIILATLFKRPIYSLARGDAFRNKLHAKLLKHLNMLPVFRRSEGIENIETNYKSFDACKEIFKQKGIVLIFSEGLCVNEWHLRTLMKGTARLVLSSWEDGIPLRVLPAGINYQDFYSFGKNIELNFGTVITSSDVDLQSGFGKNIQNFNALLREQMENLVVELDSNDTEGIQNHFRISVPVYKKILLAAPALLGYLLHFPFFFPLQKIVREKSKHTGHYDSIMVGVCFLGYPIYLGFLLLFFSLIFGCSYAILICIAAPFLAWSYVQIKPQFSQQK